MNHHRTVVLALALACAASVASAEEKSLIKSFTVAPGGVLTVDADGADISVTGNDTNTVSVRIEARGSQNELDELRLSAEPSSDGIKVEALHPSQRVFFRWGSWRVETHIVVTAPRSYRVDAKTSGGDVQLESVAGPSRLRTSGGDVQARNVKGAFEGRTSGGDMRIESMEGPVTAHTSGGDVNLTNIKGDVDADTSGGDVRLIRVDGKINAGTSGGSVRCELAGSNRGITATTSGGNVWLSLPKDISGTLDAQSSGGHIDSDFPVTMTRFSEHRLSGQINGGGNEIYVRSSGGSITLTAAK
jgi:DUF4097 and DUF4098 domain-containing protein YvlB